MKWKKHLNKGIRFLIPALLLLSSGLVSAGPLEDKLTQLSSNNVRFVVKEKQKAVSFIVVENGASIPQPYNGVASLDAEQAAINFLSEYANLFGYNYQPEYKLIKDNQTDGRHSVKLRQTVQGVPVFAGEMVVRMNSTLQVTGVNGEVASNLNDFSVKPAITKAEALAVAITSVSKKHQVRESSLRSSTSKAPSLWIYNPSLISKGRSQNTLVWRIEVVNNTSTIHELLMVDAKTGSILLDINQIMHAKNRNIHDLNNTSISTLGELPGPLVLSEGGSTAGLYQDIIDAYNYSGDTYDFYMLQHNRDSLNDAGMTLISTVRVCISGETCPWSNAAWISDIGQMIYGQGFAAADDVVGHELTHGVTSYTSNLVYADQSGAINESFSDVWGEFIDLSNTGGTDTALVRWLMGEDIPGIGAIRSMANPGDYNDPDKISSTNYYCGTLDNGGVHTNSGVNNKAAYLMVDGDTFNGITVAGIGITKTAKIYYEAQTNILTSGTTYQDLYTALQTACSTLIGTSGITSTDCNSVKNALDAVEMNTGVCGATTPAPVCPVDTTPNYVFNDGLESGLAAWTHESLIAGGTDTWSLSTLNPASGSNHMRGEDLSSTSDSVIRMTNPVTFSSGAYLRFEHQYDIEDSYDGGVIEYTTDGGTTWLDADSLIINNGYVSTLTTGTSNPLAGRPAFTGNSSAYTASRLDLNSLAGSNVQFRFRVGTDSSVGYTGWDIDNVQIYTCEGVSTKPGKATLISPTGAITDTTPAYTWNAVTGATQYNLYVNDSTGNKINTWVTATAAGCSTGTGTCSITPTTTLASGAGLWWIQTWNSSGYGPWSDPMSFTLSGVPGKATLVSPTGTITDTTPTYTWNAVTGATQYNLYVNDSTGNKIDTWVTATAAGCSTGTGTCSITPTTALATGAGNWWIRTWNSSGYGPWSNTMSFTLSSVSAPGKATLVSPTGTISNSTPTYTWDAVAGATYYKLYVNDSTGNKIDTWITATAAGCSTGTGTCSTTPTTTLATGAGNWWIRTWNSSGYGPWSNTMSFIVSDLPGKAILVSPTGTISDSTPTYTWDAVANSTYYKLYVNDSTGNKINTWVTATSAGCSSGTGTCSITPTTTLATGNAVWWIQTWNTNGYGPWSDAKTFNVVADLCSFDDQFSGLNSTNWAQRAGTWIESSGYWHTVGEVDVSHISTRNNVSCNNVDITAKMWRDGSAGNSNRIILRGSGTISSQGYTNEYLFQYTRNGEFSVYKHVNGVETALQYWATSSAINQGGAWNTLRVITNGSSMYFYINGTLVWTGTDSDLTSGEAGVGMYSPSTTDHFWVDYVTATSSAAISQTTLSPEQQAINRAANSSKKGTINSAN